MIAAAMYIYIYIYIRMLLYMRMARKAMVASIEQLVIACALDADEIRVRFIILMHER